MLYKIIILSLEIKIISFKLFLYNEETSVMMIV